MPVDLEIIGEENALSSESDLSAVIKKLRRGKGITQQEIAEKLGISQKTYSAMERNAHKAGFSRILILMSILDADLIVRPRNKDML